MNALDANASGSRGFDGQPRRLNISGEAVIGFKAVKGRSTLGALYQHDPMRVVFPTPVSGDPITASLVTTSGGMVAGDRVQIDIRLEPETGALVLPQAAEKIYRSDGADCVIDVRLAVEDGAALEWLPQETILFDGARLGRCTRIDVGGSGAVLAGEIVVLGRTAMGETLQSGRLHEDWELRRDGRLIWADRLHIDDVWTDVSAHAACLGGARAVASALYCGPDSAGLLETARENLTTAPAGVRCAATLVNGVLLARWLAVDAWALRKSFASFWTGMRSKTFGRPARLPRLWHI